MAFATPIIVQVIVPPDIGLGLYFAEMRIWLDHHHIVLRDFRYFGGHAPWIEVRFNHPREAAAFEGEYGRNGLPSAPPMPRMPLIPFVQDGRTETAGQSEGAADHLLRYTKPRRRFRDRHTHIGQTPRH